MQFLAITGMPSLNALPLPSLFDANIVHPCGQLYIYSRPILVFVNFNTGFQ